MTSKKGFNKNMIRKLLAGLLFCQLMGATAAMAVPGSMNFQGVLTNADGSRLSDGSYDVNFSLYSVAENGNPYWSENHTAVSVQNGIFSVKLGSLNALESNDFDSDSYLGITVGSDTEMVPRQQILSVGYSFKAKDADTLDGFDSSAFGHITWVNAGSGLTGGGGSGDINLVVDPGYVQRRVSASCAVDSSIRAIAEDGTVTCESDSTGGDIYGVTAGTGLSGGGSSGTVTLDADTGYLQRRVSNSCLAGYSIRAIAADGSITCEFDNDSGGDITRVIAGTGLSGGGYSGAVTLNASVPFDLSGSVTGGVVRGMNYYNASLSGPRGYGVSGEASGFFGTGVYGRASNNAIYGVYGSATGGTGVYGMSSTGIGIIGGTASSDKHGGYFYNNLSVGLNGAALYARASNTTGDGIAFWAHNDHDTSTDATVVISNDGSGALLKGFGGDDGEDEFRIDNNGSIVISDPSISDTVIWMDATRGLLTLGSGSTTTTGDDGDIWLTNSAGANTIELDGQSGEIGLFNGDHVRTIRIDPQEGTGTNDGGQITLYNDVGDVSIEIDGSYGGDGRIVTQELQITGGSDLSEHFDIDKNLNPEPGMLVSIDPLNPGKLLVSSESYDRKVAGIISGAGGIETGLMMGQTDTIADGSIPVALTGRVYCMADTSRGTIEPGDLLTTSSIPGHAMKVTDHDRAAGAIIGKAMTPLKEKQGLVLVLVSLQ